MLIGLTEEGDTDYSRCKVYFSGVSFPINDGDRIIRLFRGGVSHVWARKSPKAGTAAGAKIINRELGPGMHAKLLGVAAAHSSTISPGGNDSHTQDAATYNEDKYLPQGSSSQKCNPPLGFPTMLIGKSPGVKIRTEQCTKKGQSEPLGRPFSCKGDIFLLRIQDVLPGKDDGRFLTYDAWVSSSTVSHLSL